MSDSSTETGIRDRDAWILVGFITLVALLLRLANFGDSIAWDELSTRFVVHGRSFADMLDYVRGEQEVTPPLFFMFSWFAQRFGDTPELLRLPSLIAGLATVPLTYVLGQLTVGRKAGLFASALVALSPFMIFYSAEARPYALLTLTVLISSIALVMALRRNGFWWWALFAVACATSMYTHYTGLFVLAGQVIWALIFFPDRRKQLVAAGLAAVILYIPWIPEYKADSDSPGAAVIGALFPFKVDVIPETLAHWSYAHPFEYFGTIPGPFFGALLVAGLGLGLVGLVLKAREEHKWVPDRLKLLPVALAISAPLGTIAYSIVSVSVFLPRNMASAWVGLALVTGAVVMAPKQTALRWLSAVLVLACFSYSAFITQDRSSRRIDYAGIVSFIDQRAPDGSVIVDVPGPQPSPTAPLDVALEQDDLQIPVVRLGQPTRELQTWAIGPEGSGRYSILPVAGPRAVAKQSLSDVRGDGKLFVVYPGGQSLNGLATGSSDFGTFIGRIENDAEMIESKTLPGVGETSITVSEYSLDREG